MAISMLTEISSDKANLINSPFIKSWAYIGFYLLTSAIEALQNLPLKNPFLQNELIKQKPEIYLNLIKYSDKNPF